jgi:hypothetical protein
MINRIDDPMNESPTPTRGTVRFWFDSSVLRERAAIPPDLSRDSDDRYFAVLEEIGATGADLSRLRATTYRYGPMTAGDPAFIDLIIKGTELISAASTIAGVAAWLGSRGALETRVSEEGIEILARWELQRRGYDVGDAVSIGLTPGRGETPWGTPRQWGGYSATFRLLDGRLATLLLGLDGVFHELWLADRQAAIAVEESF